MIEALIISYNALPLDVVSSYRTKAYCDHLSKYGVKPTLLTHRWERDGNEYRTHKPDDQILVEEEQMYSVIRVPRPQPARSSSMFHTFLSYMNSDFDVELLPSYRVFRDFLWMHLAQKKYDVIIAIYNPHFSLKLAYEAFKRFGIPYVMDFRDLWDNDIVTCSYRPSLSERIVNFIIARTWGRWLKSSLFFSTTGEKWREFLRACSGKEGIIVRNGFDSMPINGHKASSRNPVFKVVHFGRMYRGQEVSIFLDGFRQFAAGFTPAQVVLELIGLKPVKGINFEDMITKELGQYASFISYMPKAGLMAYCADEAALFFLPNFSEDNGQFFVKVFDYILAGKNIVVTPGGGEVSEFVTQLNAGVVLNTAAEVKSYLGTCYRQFMTHGSVPFNINERLLGQYTREAQVKSMADKIRKVLLAEV